MNIAAFFLWLTVASPTVDFDTEIVPLLTKAGCNSGACHGAAAGRGGFHLSLLGSDPASDYEAMVQALEGRRINFVHPERSLLFAKPTGDLAHGGDTVFDAASVPAQRLLLWIRDSAPRGAPRKLTRFTVEPKRILVDKLPASLPLTAIASFDNGTDCDVTASTLFTSTDEAAVRVDEDQRAQISRRGQHVLIARFLDQVVPIQLNVPFSELTVDLSSEPRENFIDEHVLSLLEELRVPVSPRAADGAWLRRLSLDLIGRLPEPALIESFVADTSEDKRSRLIEQLMNSEAFADYWTLRFSKLLRMHSLPNESEALQAYSQWLREVINQNVQLNEVARQLLTATGDSHSVGPANFGRMVGDARSHAELVGQFFLGMQLGCANCHNHPLDRWTQDDYHGLATVFATLDRTRHVAFTARGAVTNLRTNEPAVPRLPGKRDLTELEDHREAVFEWITSDDDLYFARATVNRLWKAMFGRGLVEPADDLRQTNPATHPELLSELAKDFASNGYQIRHTLKRIALSHTYARGSATVPGNESDDRFYSHRYRVPLEPEVFADAIADLTGVALSFDGRSENRAVNLLDASASVPALDALGRCNRAGSCEATGVGSIGLAAQLHLLNGELINRRIASEEGRLSRLLQSGKSNEAIVSEFYLRGFCREPTQEELSRWSLHLRTENPLERANRLEDLVWSLLNSREFREK